MRYVITSEFATLVPEFHRGVVVGRGVDNTAFSPELKDLLETEWERAGMNAIEGSRPDVAAWNPVYRRFGADPDQHTPSIRFLYEQAARRKPVRTISPLVDIFNIISLRYGLPCGGDDLDKLDHGGVELSLAAGDEPFSSLAKPDRNDPPTRGEAIYITVPSRRVLCRRLNWRNANFSKIETGTRGVVINVDALIGPSTTEQQLRRATEDMSAMVARHCGGEVAMHLFGPHTLASSV